MSSYIGKININNTEYPIAQSLFGTCNTTANTATKVVTCADFDTLISGIVINVYFTYANTESSISLNVNSTGNKTVYVDNNSSILWDAGATKSFVYYNNQWRLINPTSVGTTYSAATTAAAGLLSASDKAKLDGLDGQYVPVQHIGSISTATINYDSNIVKIGTHSTWNNIQQKLQVEQGEYPQIRIQQQDENNNQIYSSITLDTHKGIYLDSDKNIYIGSGTTSGVQITQVADPVNAQDAVNKRYVDNIISGGILKGIRINSSDSYVSSLGSNVYLITHNQGFAENFTSTVMVKNSSSSYFYQAINDDGVSLVYTSGKIRYDIFDIQENQFKIEFSSVPYQFSILINTNYDSLSLVDVDSTQTLLNV